MIRGCELVQTQEWSQKYGTSFQRLDCKRQDEVMLPRLENAPMVKHELVAEASATLHKLSELDMGTVETGLF